MHAELCRIVHRLQNFQIRFRNKTERKRADFTSKKVKSARFSWSRRRESNPRSQLGKLEIKQTKTVDISMFSLRFFFKWHTVWHTKFIVNFFSCGLNRVICGVGINVRCCCYVTVSHQVFCHIDGYSRILQIRAIGVPQTVGQRSSAGGVAITPSRFAYLNIRNMTWRILDKKELERMEQEGAEAAESTADFRFGAEHEQ